MSTDMQEPKRDEVDEILGVLFGKINSNPRTSNYIFDEDDGAIAEAKAAINHLIARKEKEAQLKGRIYGFSQLLHYKDVPHSVKTKIRERLAYTRALKSEQGE